MSVNQREHPVIKGEDAKRFLENEKEVDGKLKDYINNLTKIRQKGVYISRNFCLAGLIHDYMNENNIYGNEKEEEIADLLLEYSIWLEKQLQLCTSHFANKDLLDKDI
jgi:hypothetical protein